MSKPTMPTTLENILEHAVARPAIARIPSFLVSTTRVVQCRQFGRCTVQGVAMSDRNVEVQPERGCGWFVHEGYVLETVGNIPRTR